MSIEKSSLSLFSKSFAKRVLWGLFKKIGKEKEEEEIGWILLEFREMCVYLQHHMKLRRKS